MYLIIRIVISKSVRVPGGHRMHSVVISVLNIFDTWGREITIYTCLYSLVAKFGVVNGRDKFIVQRTTFG
jgi:hypothetical protein